MIVKGGATNVTTYFAMRLSADGTAATGLTATDFDLQYVRSGAAPSAKVDATAGTAGGAAAHSDNTVVEPDATDQPGLYRVDWPDAAFATGVGEVILTVKVATAYTEHLRVELDPPVSSEAVIKSTFTGTPTVTELFDSTLGSTDDLYNGRTIYILDGSGADQATNITDYDQATNKLTVTSLAVAPTSGDAYLMV